jgi:hypothetical protein
LAYVKLDDLHKLDQVDLSIPLAPGRVRTRCAPFLRSKANDPRPLDQKVLDLLSGPPRLDVIAALLIEGGSTVALESFDPVEVDKIWLFLASQIHFTPKATQSELPGEAPAPAKQETKGAGGAKGSSSAPAVATDPKGKTAGAAVDPKGKGKRQSYVSAVTGDKSQ